MPAPRKKWSTTLIGWRQSHQSKVAAYRYVQAVGVEFRAGELGGAVREVKVWVDEGRGWELYEVVDLKDLVSP